MNKGCRETPRSMPSTDKYRDGWERIFGQQDKLERNKKDNKRDDKKP